MAVWRVGYLDETREAYPPSFFFFFNSFEEGHRKIPRLLSCFSLHGDRGCLSWDFFFLFSFVSSLLFLSGDRRGSWDFPHRERRKRRVEGFWLEHLLKMWDLVLENQHWRSKMGWSWRGHGMVGESEGEREKARLGYGRGLGRLLCFSLALICPFPLKPNLHCYIPNRPPSRRVLYKCA